MKTYQAIAHKMMAIGNCVRSGNEEWYDKHHAALKAIMDNAPSGSGIDGGTQLDFNEEFPNSEQLVFTTAYHHMNENGMYDGWTEHKITVSPSLAFGISIKITGKNRNDIKDYLHDLFDGWLNGEV